MKVKIERIRKGTYLPRAKVVLRKMVFVRQEICDTIIDDMSLHDIPVTLGLRGPLVGADWDAFNDIFVYTQVPEGSVGTGKQFIDVDDDDEWTNEEMPEEDPTEMLLFCIKTNGKETGNKFEILVLATTEEIALKSCIQDRAVVAEIKVVPGPFKNGTVLSTKLITK